MSYPSEPSLKVLWLHSNLNVISNWLKAVLWCVFLFHQERNSFLPQQLVKLLKKNICSVLRLSILLFLGTITRSLHQVILKYPVFQHCNFTATRTPSSILSVPPMDYQLRAQQKYSMNEGRNEQI